MEAFNGFINIFPFINAFLKSGKISLQWIPAWFLGPPAWVPPPTAVSFSLNWSITWGFLGKCLVFTGSYPCPKGSGKKKKNNRLTVAKKNSNFWFTRLPQTRGLRTCYDTQRFFAYGKMEKQQGGNPGVAPFFVDPLAPKILIKRNGVLGVNLCKLFCFTGSRGLLEGNLNQPKKNYAPLGKFWFAILVIPTQDLFS